MSPNSLSVSSNALVMLLFMVMSFVAADAQARNSLSAERQASSAERQAKMAARLANDRMEDVRKVEQQMTDDRMANQQFLREYGLGVRRIPMDGGRIYGWKLNDRLTFGRFKGENDEFGFSVEVNSRQRVEVTKDGVRWRKALGGGSR